MMPKNEKENVQRICHVCNSPIRPKAQWDNPRRDPRYPALWLCKTHSKQIVLAYNATYDRWISEARRKVDQEKAKRRPRKDTRIEELDPQEEIKAQ
jgi:hypothetical protein